MTTTTTPALQLSTDPVSGKMTSVSLFGNELLDLSTPCRSELFVNGRPLEMRLHRDPNQPGEPHLKGEHFVDHFCGWSLVLARTMGERPGMKYHCNGIHTLIRRELADASCPCPGPGGPVVEAPLWVDSFSILNWPWRFWGEDTRMIFPSLHSTGPSDEFGHCGYEHDTPENCKRYLQNAWRRLYPGVMAVHGGLYYHRETEHWLAITCRQPTVGYLLNINDAGRGVSYDFTLHAPFALGDSLQLPEIKLYYGQSHEEMMRWLADYITFYYEEPPEWVHRTLFTGGLAWTNEPTWNEQADTWERELAGGTCSGIGYSLVTNRPIQSGTTPLGYEPDPNHGTQEDFRRMCRRLADAGVPLLIWMSHSGLLYQGGADIDDDWFIRGIDGRVNAAWGSIDGTGLTSINPGHPGYLEYTKKWIRFYITECGAKGIFFDCLGWAFPPDFRPRSFMRYPGDTNLMGIRFMREVYRCIKECDPEAIMLGEGTSLEAPVNIFSVNSNPVRAVDGLGPRDFLLQLNRYSGKRLVIDQGPAFFPAGGMCKVDPHPAATERNRYLTQLLRSRGGRITWTALPGDLSLLDDLLVVPADETGTLVKDIRLPAPWDGYRTLTEVLEGRAVRAGSDGAFMGVGTGIYRLS